MTHVVIKRTSKTISLRLGAHELIRIYNLYKGCGYSLKDLWQLIFRQDLEEKGNRLKNSIASMQRSIASRERKLLRIEQAIRDGDRQWKNGTS